MDGAADAALGAWASIRGFFTPATLFLVVNLVIGTIWLTSRSHQRLRRRGSSGYTTTAHDDDTQAQHQEEEQQPFHHQQEQEHQYYDEQHQEQEYVPPPPAPAPLARTSSVLDRLRSIGLYRFRSGDFPPEYDAGTDQRDGVDPAVAGGDIHHDMSRSEPARMREERRRPAPSRTKKSSSSVARRAEVPPPVPAARVVQARAAVLDEDDGFVEQEYAFTDDNFITQQQQPLPPAPAPAQHEEMRRPAPSRMKKPSSEARSAEVPPVPTARAVQFREAVREEDDDSVDEEEYAIADEFTDDNFITHQQQQQQPPLPHEEEEEEQYYREEYVPPLRPAPLARAPSVLERLRSFGLYRFRSGEVAADDAAAAVAELERNQAQKQQATQYSRSRSEPSREQGKKGKKQLQQQGAAESKMSKSSSEARRPVAAPEEAVAEEGGVDARADDFINSFRKQLQLQRLNSLLNYKDMLNRGA